MRDMLRDQRAPVFSGSGGVTAAAPTTFPTATGASPTTLTGGTNLNSGTQAGFADTAYQDAGAAQQAAGTSAVAGGTDLSGIFQQEMEQQKQLYAQITILNADKNRQSSYLSLAKGVSEKV